MKQTSLILLLCVTLASSLFVQESKDELLKESEEKLKKITLRVSALQWRIRDDAK